jgi:dienelactone hydrolase
VKRIVRILAGILAGIALLLGIVMGVSLRPASDDPLASLPRGKTAVLIERRSEARGGRLFQHVTLSDARLGPVDFTISLPDPLPSSKLPLVVVLGGLGTGANNIRFVDDAGDNAIIGYDWPLPAAMPKGLRALTEIPSLRRRALSVPGQIGVMLRWLATQPWSDPGRISVLGFSLGAIATPAAERVAQQDGVDVRWTVLAYGGVGLDALVEGDRRIRPAWIRPLFGAGAALLLWPLEPAAHLPHLPGHFLIIGAARDTIVEPRASARLEELTPEPKTIIHTAGDHVGTGPDRQALLEEAMAATRRWLAAKGAVNSVEPCGQKGSGDGGCGAGNRAPMR